jgi:hypothetical protein
MVCSSAGMSEHLWGSFFLVFQRNFPHDFRRFLHKQLYFFIATTGFCIESPYIISVILCQ